MRVCAGMYLYRVSISLFTVPLADETYRIFFVQSNDAQLIWIYTVCKGSACPDSAGPGLISVKNTKF